MELATLQLKLGGDAKNTVYKQKVTPAQLAIYAFMHGEDCVQSLDVTGVDKERTVFEEKTRLERMFSTEEGIKVINHLFPGIAPQYPVTFQSVGYDPVVLADTSYGSESVHKPPQPSSEAASTIVNKIKSADEQRKADEQKTTQMAEALAIAEEEEAEMLDDTGGYEGEGAGALDLDDDPIDLELQNMQEEESSDETPPPAPAPAPEAETQKEAVNG